MGGRIVRFAVCFLLGVVAAGPAVAAGGCKLGKVAELPVVMDGLAPLVATTVNGQPARFAVDTGAFFSMVTPRAADRFKLPREGLPPGFHLEGAVGSAEAELGRADVFGIAGTSLHRVDFLIAGENLGHDVDGLLGQNILGLMDVEYDFANGVIRMFRTDGCGDAMLAYWAKGLPVSILRFRPTTTAEPLIVADAKVNDVSIRVLFDTGAGPSVLKLAAARRAGADIQDADAQVGDVMRGIGPRAVDSSIVPFASFTVGGEIIQHTRLRVGKGSWDISDMLLGTDFFLSHRVLISHSQGKIYFTYNGGPVFRLEDGASTSTKMASASPNSGPKGADGGGEAGVFERRGAALLARRDFKGAAEAFDRAIALEPRSARLYYARARARLAAHDAAGGATDLDQALKLDPAFGEALMLRGYRRLEAKDAAGADADFAAALKASPDDPEFGLVIADVYTHASRFGPAIAQYDAWIAAHQNSMDLSEALNGRCWTRALWGHELDKALLDCDQALRRGSRLAAVLDSRGLVHLRRGEFDKAIADYDAAIRLQPKEPWSLYGRGLAKLKKGDAPGGEADIEAARKIDPDLPKQAERFGVTEKTVVAVASP